MTGELSIAAAGWVATEPREVVGDGVPYTSFRLAHTPRRRIGTGEWADGETVWFTVKAWRDAAFNIAASVRKGEPVLVQGRLRVEHWQRGEEKGTTLVLEADAVGHDLMRGTTRFARRKYVLPGHEENANADGRDVDPWGEDADGRRAAGLDEPDVAAAFGQEPPDDVSGQHPASTAAPTT